MKGDATVVTALNNCLKDQLTVINQLFLHARMSKDWGLNKLNDYDYKASIKSMKMADTLIERVLFLEGLPNLQHLGKLRIGEDVPELLKGNLTMQLACRGGLQQAMTQCEQVQDYLSRDLLEDMLEHTEEHIDWIETQQWQIANMGIENYLQSQTLEED